jgi:hypothetical protein
LLIATTGGLPAPDGKQALLVQDGPGEFYRCPSGRVVEGTTAADRKVVVGYYGPVEITFVLRRVAATWRVEAEPYFVAINQ